MTVKETLTKVAAKVDKVVSGFDDEKEKKCAVAPEKGGETWAEGCFRNPAEMEVDPSVKAVNSQIPNTAHDQVYWWPMAVHTVSRLLMELCHDR